MESRGMAAGLCAMRKCAYIGLGELGILTSSHHTMVIRWSEEDGAFVVSLPEWLDRVLNPVTHGVTYDQAAANGHDVLELLIASSLDLGQPLPELGPIALGR